MNNFFVFLHSSTASSYGPVTMRPLPGTVIGSLTPRMTRQATLDGGATITNLGTYWEDSDIVIMTEIDNTAETDLKNLVKNETTLFLSTENGIFEGGVSRLRFNHGEVSFTFQPSEQGGV